MARTKPLLLDLFCGAGGAAQGYADAGFRVIGVDIERHADYPFRLIRADVADVMRWDLTRYDVIHASPPCQRWSTATADPSKHPDWIAPVRRLCKRWRVPYVIENVPRAPLIDPVQLCGSAFGLDVWRHRHMESNVRIYGKRCQHSGPPVGVYGIHPDDYGYPRANGNRRGRKARDVAEAQAALETPWISTWPDLVDAIPPAYTHWIGLQLIADMERTAQTLMWQQKHGIVARPARSLTLKNPYVPTDSLWP